MQWSFLKDCVERFAWLNLVNIESHWRLENMSVLTIHSRKCLDQPSGHMVIIITRVMCEKITKKKRACWNEGSLKFHHQWCFWPIKVFLRQNELSCIACFARGELQMNAKSFDSSAWCIFYLILFFWLLVLITVKVCLETLHRTFQLKHATFVRTKIKSSFHLNLQD